MRKIYPVLLVVSLLFLLSGCLPVAPIPFPDFVPPSVTITYPQNTAFVRSAVTIKASALDNVGVTKVEFYVDGAKIGEDTTAPYQCSWDTTKVADGTHKISAWAYDKAGNIGKAEITVTADNTPPSVALTSPLNNFVVSKTVTLKANATDNIGVAKVVFYVDGTKIGEATTAPYQCSWDTNTASNGFHQISARAYDKAGNVAEAGGTRNYVWNAKAPADWTVMVYMSGGAGGGQDLTQHAFLDIEEMEKVGSTDKVNVVAQLDLGHEGSCRRWFILKDNDPHHITSPIWQAFPSADIDVGDPAVLVDFMKQTIATFPANHYALILWDHGSGWPPTEPRGRAVCWDDAINDALDMDELRGAFEEVFEEVGVKLDFLGMDACLMQMVEVAYEVKDWVGVVCASEETEPGYGWPYDAILNALVTNPSLDAEQLGKMVVDDYISACQYYGEPYATLSVVRTAQIDNLATALNNLGYVLAQAAQDPQTKSTLSQIAQYSYLLSGPQAGYLYADIICFAYLVYKYIPGARDAVNAVANAWKDVVVYTKQIGTERLNPDPYDPNYYLPDTGLSIYLPVDKSGVPWGNSYQELRFSQAAPGWFEFLKQMNSL